MPNRTAGAAQPLPRIRKVLDLYEYNKDEWLNPDNLKSAWVSCQTGVGMSFSDGSKHLYLKQTKLLDFIDWLSRIEEQEEQEYQAEIKKRYGEDAEYIHDIKKPRRLR